MNKPGVYQIANKFSGSLYIGSALNLSQRRRSHWQKLRKGRGQTKLQCAWNSYGEDAFEFKPLLICSPDNLLLYEQLLIDELRPKYNTREVAHSNLGVKWGADTLTKMRNRANIAFHEVRGIRGSLEYLAKHFGQVSAHCAGERVRKYGWSVEDAVCSPPIPRAEILRRAAKADRSGRRAWAQQFEVNGVTGSIGELADKFGVVSETTARNRIKDGWEVAKAVTHPLNVRKSLSVKRARQRV